MVGRDVRLVDGVPTFATESDEASEDEVAQMIRQRWEGVGVHRMPRYSAVDYYFTRSKDVIGWGELKTRQIASNDYDTVFLALTKWHSLMTYSMGTQLPVLFIVRFKDEVRWIDVMDVDATKPQVGGHRRIVKARGDREPIIHVPIKRMKLLCMSTEPS